MCDDGDDDDGDDDDDDNDDVNETKYLQFVMNINMLENFI